MGEIQDLEQKILDNVAIYSDFNRHRHTLSGELYNRRIKFLRSFFTRYNVETTCNEQNLLMKKRANEEKVTDYEIEWKKVDNKIASIEAEHAIAIEANQARLDEINTM